VRGKSFNLPEQAAVLLQQAFEALSKASSDPMKLLEGFQAKGKGAAMLESVEDVSKLAIMADGVESSRQGQLVRKAVVSHHTTSVAKLKAMRLRNVMKECFVVSVRAWIMFR
jgi:hypothetical protein